MKNALSTPVNRLVSVAPMMGWTDRHDRYFLRLISPNALLYTVMITTGALIHGKKTDILDYNPEEHPVALQLGGSDPAEMAICAKMAEDWGYDEVNINCGCPSERVQKGAFGACLMAEPGLVADCVDAMKQACTIPVTIKTRIGIDDKDSYQFLVDFVGASAERGCNTFIIHARKAILKGLSPAENRTVPPLRYEVAYQLKKDFPTLEIILNGGIKTVEDIQSTLPHVDGVMIGREAYSNPWLLAEIEDKIFNNKVTATQHDIVGKMIPYMEKRLLAGDDLKDITRHILGLFQGMKGARQWRRILSEDAYKPGANTDVVQRALAAIAQG